MMPTRFEFAPKAFPRGAFGAFLFRTTLALCLFWGISTLAEASPAQDSLRRFEFSHPQMGTIFRLVFYAPIDTSEAAKCAKKVFAAVDSLNASMSDYLPESELNRLCARAGTGVTQQVSPDLWRILRLANGFSRRSDGAFDVSIGPLTRLWRRARNLKELPDSAKMEEARQLVDFHNITIKKGKKIRLEKAGMRLDLGGIAQGYAADRCLEILRKNGITRALADAGGDIALGAAPPGATGWEIALPEGIDGPRTLRLAHCGITSSGANYRYVELNGKRYSHIVDPRTGWGLTHHTLVTVQAPDATTADAWATAISVLGKTGWGQLKRRPGHLKVWLTKSR